MIDHFWRNMVGPNHDRSPLIPQVQVGLGGIVASSKDFVEDDACFLPVTHHLENVLRIYATIIYHDMSIYV